MAEPLRHRQTKGAATDMFYLTPPRHISTLPKGDLTAPKSDFSFSPDSRHAAAAAACPFRAHKPTSAWTGIRERASGSAIRSVVKCAVGWIARHGTRAASPG